MAKEETPTRWLICKHCKKRQATNAIAQDAVCIGVETKCKHCHQVFEIKVFNGVQIFT